MPERSERFFWLHTRQIDGTVSAKIDAANQQFAATWTACELTCTPCVATPVMSDRLSLFRLATNDQTLATKFNGQLTNHIKGLGASVGVPDLFAKRQTNLPQPLVCPRVGTWPKTDLGLHSVNDQYNGMLVSYSYHEGRFYHIPHLQLSTLIDLCSTIQGAWQVAACDCYRTASSCCGVGCYDCFQASCPTCDGTGWKDFAKWVQGGYQVDYSSGVPIAKL
jgi:hypothetical protein